MSLLKKADEMEQYIALRSLKVSSVFTSFALLVWAFYQIYKESSYYFPLALLLAQNLIFFSMQLYLKRKLSEENEE